MRRKRKHGVHTEKLLKPEQKPQKKTDRDADADDGDSHTKTTEDRPSSFSRPLRHPQQQQESKLLPVLLQK